VSEIADHPQPLSNADKASPNDPTKTLEAAQRKLPRRRFVDDMPDKGLFLLVAIIGFGAILWLKTHNFKSGLVIGLNSDRVAIFAVALMLIYGLIAMQITQVRLRPDRLGDNFYYLGFIFTLASLSAALMQFRGGVKVDDLVSSFGIALLTTIVGIVGRVVFLQMRSELDDVEEAVRRDLAATASELKAQLGTTIREFEVFRTTLLQSMTETQQECVKTARKQIESLSAFERELKKFSDQSFDANRRHTTSIEEATNSLSRSVKNISDQAAGMSLPNERLNEQLREFAISLEALLKRLGNIVEDVASRANRRRRFWFFGS
jgi:methyl-accepting chemotaxis protein